MGKIKKFLLKALWQDPNYEMDQMACDEITIEQIDGTLYEKLLGQATGAGAQFAGQEATFKGCTFDWNYDAAAGVLHVTCKKKPFYFTCGLVETEIRKLVDAARTDTI